MKGGVFMLDERETLPFTLIGQTLQQLKDIYGESAYKMIQENAQPFVMLNH